MSTYKRYFAVDRTKSTKPENNEHQTWEINIEECKNHENVIVKTFDTLTDQEVTPHWSSQFQKGANIK